MNITAKIWLGMAVFILGYMLSAALSQIQRAAKQPTF
jgi:hypothetical protein